MLVGMNFMLLLYRVFGRTGFSIVLFPVMCYYYLVRTEARHASRQYLLKIRTRMPPTETVRLTTFRHFLMFGETLLDKLLVWMGRIKREDVVFDTPAIIKQIDADRSGGVIVVSHLGNFEICNALAHEIPDLSLTILVYTQHAGKFNSLMKNVSGDVDVEVLQVTDMSPATIMMFADRVNAGGYIVIAADRTPVSGQGRVSEVDFLGSPAPFPQGAFILQGLLNCPLYLMFCLKEQEQYHIYVEPFEVDLEFQNRSTRQLQLHNAIQQYANRLEYYCLKAPLQWFNFFPFWSPAKAPQATHDSSPETGVH